MMTMAGRLTSCCVALLLVLSSVSAAHKKLKSIKDLKKIDFGQSVPKHSLMLLHWFANEVDIDNNNVIQLTFDPNSDYGSHHYGNYETMLDPLPRGYQYFTVGNLNQDTSRDLPDYVVDPPMEYEGENRDRIIIRVRGQTIDQVYITQHYDTSEHQGTPYDPEHTYRVTLNLLRQIREFSVRDGQLPLLHLRNRFQSNTDDFYIRQTWGNLACLGLLLFIVIEEKHLWNHCKNSPKKDNRPKNNRRENNHRPENNYRVENYYRPENYHRVENYDRLENYYRPVNYNRPETNSLDNNNRRRRCCCWAIFCFLILLLVLAVVFWVIFRH